MERNILQLESKEITKAKQLLDEGKFEESLLILNNLEEKAVLTPSDKLLCFLIKSYILISYGNNEESLKYSQKAYQESIVLKNHLATIDALVIMARALTWLGDLEKALNLAIQGEDILKNLSNISTPECEKREATIAGVKGFISWSTGDTNQAIMYANRSFELSEKLGNNNTEVFTDDEDKTPFHFLLSVTSLLYLVSWRHCREIYIMAEK